MKLVFDLIFYEAGIIAFLFFVFLTYIVKTNKKLDFVIKQLANENKDLKNIDNNISKKKHRKYFKLISFLEKLKEILSEKIRVKNLLKEYFVTVNIITVVGGGILAVGTGYFVRFTIYNNLIDIVGRIILSIIVSTFLIIVAHKLRKTHRAFSAILMGTALGILYYIAGSAYYNYNLFGEETVLLISFFLTVFSVTLSFFYNRLSLLILSVIAAYTAPFLISYNLSAAPNILFTYILLIDIGVLVVLSFRKSIILILISFTFTGLFFLIWLIISLSTNNYDNFADAFVFVTIFYIILFPIHTINNLLNNNKFIPFELASILTLNSLYYAGGGVLIHYLNPEYLGLFTMFIAIWNLFLLFIIQNIKNADTSISYFLIGLFVIFISIIPPIEFVGKSISMVWAIQIVVVLYVGQKTDMFTMRLASSGLVIATIVFASFDLYNIYESISIQANPKPVILNLDFIASTMVVAGLFAYSYLLIHSKKEYFIKFVKTKLLAGIFVSFAILLLYFNILLEINYHITISIESELARKIITGIYNFTFILILNIPLLFIKNKKINLISGIFLNISLLLYFIFYYFIIIKSRNELFSAIGLSSAQFWYHLIIIGLLILISFLAYLNFKKYFSYHKVISEFTLWPFIILVLIFISFEFNNVWLVLFKEDNELQAELLPKIHRLPYTLLWSIFAAILITLGTFFNIRQLRQVSVFIIFISILKLFVWDLAKTEPAGKTIPLMAIGSILLLVSFIYQFNKK